MDFSFSNESHAMSAWKKTHFLLYIYKMLQLLYLRHKKAIANCLLGKPVFRSFSFPRDELSWVWSNFCRFSVSTRLTKLFIDPRTTAVGGTPLLLILYLHKYNFPVNINTLARFICFDEEKKAMFVGALSIILRARMTETQRWLLLIGGTQMMESTERYNLLHATHKGVLVHITQNGL